MGKIPQISPSEWRVMAWLWSHGPATANEVVAGVEPDSEWNHRTIRTLLNRLVQKGAVAVRKGAGDQTYHPKVEEKACVRAESQSFLARVFGNAVVPALATLLEERRLSAKEMDELRAILETKTKRGS